MTSTQIKINTPASKLGQLTGMSSLSFKVVSILFLVIINISGLSSQTAQARNKNCQMVIKPTVSYSKKATVAPRPSKIRYNLHIVRNFPILEGETKQEFNAVEVHELFDYDLIFSGAFTKVKTNTKTISITSISTSKL